MYGFYTRDDGNNNLCAILPHIFIHKTIHRFLVARDSENQPKTIQQWGDEMIKKIPKKIMVEFPKNIRRFKYGLCMWVDIMEVDISNRSKKYGFSPGDIFSVDEREFIFLGICVRTGADGQRQKDRPVVYKKGDKVVTFFDKLPNISTKTGHIDL